MKEEGLEINIKKKSIDIKGYLMKKGKPLKERVKDQFDELREFLS